MLRSILNRTLPWLRCQLEISRGYDTNVRTMEGLRGFAVFLVFLVHYASMIQPWLLQQSHTYILAKWLEAFGQSGVDLFFVLSGYLIYGSLITRKQPFLRFMRRRAQRIYPAFLVVFVLYIGLSLVFPAESKIPKPFSAGFAYLIQNLFFLPGLLPIKPMIVVAWSLSYEMFFYLVIPLLINWLGLRRRMVTTRITLFLLIGIIIAIYCSTFGGYPRLIMFIAGIVLFDVEKNGLVRSPGDALGLTCLIGGLLLMPVAAEGPTAGTLKLCLLAVSFFVLCRSCFSGSGHLTIRMFSWTPIRWLGNLSYSYYLLHVLVLKAAFLSFAFMVPPSADRTLIFWVLLPSLFAATLIPVGVLFLAVEKPFSLKQSRAVNKNE